MKKDGSTATRYTFKDNATGTYSESEIRINLKSGISGNTFTFIGNRENSSFLKVAGSVTKYIGTVTLLLDGKITEFTDISIFKY